ncbi:hypothetical protein [Nocardioides campestrisoli]|uniref:hypothetical protein n=1 Tax=Nocardioides campestrisoli TaxID=2736757 RepID=UPI0015E74E3C|nr:hypothetical protein [Nocardioides campestrisoli]
MPTSLPLPSFSQQGGGWLLACRNIASCNYESWHPRRSGADLAWRDHVKKHAPKGGDRG